MAAHGNTIVSSSWVLALLLLGGCAAADVGMPAPPTPAALTRMQAVSEGTGAVNAPEGPASLQQLIAYARDHAPRSLLAEASTFAPDAELDAARQRALYNPVVRVALGTRTQAGDTGLEAQVGISQRLEVARERRLRIAAAESRLEQADKVRGASVWEVEVEVRRLYRMATILDDLVGLTEQAARAADELAQVTSKRVDAGEEPPLAAELARARAALIEADTRSTRAERDSVIGSLAAASGWPRGKPLTLADKTRRWRRLPDDAALIEAALGSNRQRATLEASITRAVAGRRLAQREAWPEPTLGASYAREAGVANSQAADVVLGTVDIPIPSFARNQSARARARADERASKAALAAFDRGVPGEVEAASARVRGALERMDALSDVAAARDTRQLMALREAYDAGEVGLLEVLRALEQGIETRTAMLAAEADYVNAVAGLELLVGASVGSEDTAR